ncbi:MAG: hypothetical protein Q7R42_04015 [Candidatus Planktophila sp.]|nr:hypothetical protein [Candidatus Planktophila sp.]
MKKIKLALIAAVVGAMSLAPTQLLPAAAAILGSAVSPSQSVSTGNYGAVAGASSAATATSAFVVDTMVSSCSFNQSTVNSNTPNNSSTISLVAVTNLAVGMIISTTTGIAAGTKVTAINTGTRVITITPNTTAQIGKSVALTFSGCYQKYFNVNNIRSIALSSFQIQQTVNTTAPDSVTLQSCAGTWTEATGACTGAITNIVVTNSGTSAFTTVTGALAATTGTVRLRALSNTSGRTSTISINIARVNLRAAITTNS